ncbi:TPA: polyamine aminopropyltransferase [bacterium]|nr:polyamine aminopropyltransferase [bacterium]
MAATRWFFMSNPDETVYGLKGNLLASFTSEFQTIEVVETQAYGRCLILDSKIQSAEYDEFIYHEALVHPAMITHPSPQRVFIAGGGEGAVLREVLRHNTIDRVVMVDIDPLVVEVAKRYLERWHRGAFDDRRVTLIYGDAREYLEKTGEKFDLIVIDISEPIEEGPAYLLFTKEFYLIARERLSSPGAIVAQAGSGNIAQILCFSSVYKTLKGIFNEVFPYWVFVPSYVTTWGFVMASDSLNPQRLTSRDVETRIQKKGITGLKYYDSKIHTEGLELPAYILKALEERGCEVRDEEPLTYV